MQYKSGFVEEEELAATLPYRTNAYTPMHALTGPGIALAMNKWPRPARSRMVTASLMLIVIEAFSAGPRRSVSPGKTGLLRSAVVSFGQSEHSVQSQGLWAVQYKSGFVEEEELTATLPYRTNAL